MTLESSPDHVSPSGFPGRVSRSALRFLPDDGVCDACADESECGGEDGDAGDGADRDGRDGRRLAEAERQLGHQPVLRTDSH